MKILFFTPCLLASAIGRVSRLVVAELLKQGHEVVVVRSENSEFFEGPIHTFICQVVPWTDFDLVHQLAAQSEVVIYQIGDNYQYHRGCLEWLPSTAGLVSLHDNFLGHLFWSWSEKIGRQNAQDLLTSMYGSEVAGRFFDHASSATFIAYASVAAPMTEWIASMAKAVIVHSSWAMDRISSACPGPVAVVPLPYDAPFLEARDLREISSCSEQVVALTIGHVNPNKRYASVIRAIGASPLLRQRMSFRIVGSVEPKMAQELASLAECLKVKVEIVGVVDDRQLADEIHNADIMSCLRWPALEAASASTIEAMLYGKPIVVTDTGFYRDLPDDCVLKVSPEAELIELQAALEKLLTSPTARVKQGELARQYAIKTFRADNYADHVLAMKRRIDRSAIVASGARMITDTLKGWGGGGDPEMMELIIEPLRLFR